MAKDLSQTTWHGVPRREVPWQPTVDEDACIGCELCFVTCGREVFEMASADGRRLKAAVERANNCMVGCSTCAVVCPTQAITFPSRDIVWKVEREHKIFRTVRAEAKEKRGKADTMVARQKAEEQLAGVATRAPVRVAGLFGEKRFLVQLEERIKRRPYDIVNLELHVPTLQGLTEGAPAYMDFEVTSTSQEDVAPFVSELRSLVGENGLVWVER